MATRWLKRKMGHGASIHEDLNDAGRSAEAASQTDPCLTFYPNENSIGDLEDIQEITKSLKKAWAAVDVKIRNRKDNDNAETLKRLDGLRNRTGWKTVRIFVSSTFKDFNSEREVLVKEVFPDLRAWCEERRLHLVECDLRWGVPSEATEDVKIAICLEEIDRCKQENVLPFFLNMTGERVGWIPERKRDNMSDLLINKYDWVFSLSVTEMEIVHGALSYNNPNALFMIRDDSFLANTPKEFQNVFKNHKEEKTAPYKLPILKEKIVSTFPKDQVFNYGCNYKEQDRYGKPVLKCDDDFGPIVRKFFQERIEAQYSLPTDDEENSPSRWQKEKRLHEGFALSRADIVSQRGDEVNKVLQYIDQNGKVPPKLIRGVPGMGKSSVMAVAVASLTSRLEDTADVCVFSHFVGAVPDSRDILGMFHRFLVEVHDVKERELPTDVETAAFEISSVLRNGTRFNKTIIFVDAINQFQDAECEVVRGLTWLPSELSERVRCIVSTVNDTAQDEIMWTLSPLSPPITLQPLTVRAKKDITKTYLKKFGKTIDVDQFVDLIEKKSSDNALWLTMACEELRIFGLFRNLSDKTAELEDSLEKLGLHIVRRLVQESGVVEGPLLMAALCLLQVAQNGLLEHELKSILADQSFFEIAHSDAVTDGVFRHDGSIHSHHWAVVWRGLRAFIRPIGDIGEGRLGFYHQTLSDAVFRAYFDSKGEYVEKYSPKESTMWNQKLADYFIRCNAIDRKVEALPYHLIQLKKTKELQEFLCKWETFNKLFHKEHSRKLVKYWQACGGANKAADCFKIMLDQSRLGRKTDADLQLRVARFLMQAGASARTIQEIVTRAMSHDKTSMEAMSIRADLYYQEVQEDHSLSDSSRQYACLTNCLQLHSNIIAALENSHNKENEVATQRTKLALRQSALAEIEEASDLQAADKLKKEARQNVKTALRYYMKTGDIGKQAELYMTIGRLLDGNQTKQLDVYTKALRLSKQAHGTIHTLTYRVLLNTAHCYRRAGKWDYAYDEYKKSYEVAAELFGPTHLKSTSVIEYMNVGKIREVAIKRKDDRFMELLQCF